MSSFPKWLTGSGFVQTKFFNSLSLNNRRDGVGVGAYASQSVDLGYIPLVESYQKTLKILSIASLLGARNLWEVVENKPGVRLLCPWARHITGRSTFMWKTGDPEITAPKRVRTYHPKRSDTSLSCEWRMNMAYKKKGIFYLHTVKISGKNINYKSVRYLWVICHHFFSPGIKLKKGSVH